MRCPHGFATSSQYVPLNPGIWLGSAEEREALGKAAERATKRKEELPAGAAAPSYDFEEGLQSQLLNFMMRDYQFATQSAGLIKPEYFTDEANSALARLANDHFKAYKEPLGTGKVFVSVFKAAAAAKKIRPEIISEIKKRALRSEYRGPLKDREFLLSRAVEFAKNRAVENAILQSAELLTKGDYAKIDKLMREALMVGGAKKVNVYDYYKSIDARTQHRKDLLAGVIKRNGITSGVPDFDKLLYQNGWGRKELTVMIAPPRGGI